MEKIHLNVTIGSPVDSPNSVLLRALRELRDSPQPYQIPVISTNGKSFVLSTTHKETHLALGKLSPILRLMLCDFFEEAYCEKRDPEMIFTFEPERITEKPRALQVVRMEGVSTTRRTPTFHLSPIH